MDIDTQKSNQKRIRTFVLTVIILAGLVWVASEYKRPDAPAAEQKPQLIVSENIPIGLNFTRHFAQTPQAKDEIYVIPNHLPMGKYALEGRWEFTDSAAVLKEAPGKVKLHFRAKKVMLAASSPKPATVKVASGSGTIEFIQIEKPGPYQIFQSTELSENVLEITFPDKEVEIYELGFE